MVQTEAELQDALSAAREELEALKACEDSSDAEIEACRNAITGYAYELELMDAHRLIEENLEL